jgi:hypothetical protein
MSKITWHSLKKFENEKEFDSYLYFDKNSPKCRLHKRRTENVRYLQTRHELKSLMIYIFA